MERGSDERTMGDGARRQDLYNLDELNDPQIHSSSLHPEMMVKSGIAGDQNARESKHPVILTAKSFSPKIALLTTRSVIALHH